MEKTHAILAVTEVTLNYITAARKRLKRKEWGGGEKMLDMNVDSCILNNSAADQRSSTPVMLQYLGGADERRGNNMWMTRPESTVLFCEPCTMQTLGLLPTLL